MVYPAIIDGAIEQQFGCRIGNGPAKACRAQGLVADALGLGQKATAMVIGEIIDGDDRCFGSLRRAQWAPLSPRVWVERVFRGLSLT